ncbi:MAG: leucine-rich repeat domain-containing protein [Saprospiraceae bacterium]|nr:leucine-rich repeat domain-containing protein [Saprospiraceae bacterium]
MIFFTACFVSVFLTKTTAQCSRAVDSLSLVILFNDCQGIDWSNKSNWLVPGKNLSTWYGVKVNASGCVESLTLPTNKLSGALPSEIGNFKALKTLILTNNNLSGNLPTQIGNLTSLEELNLATNKLNGPMHPTFGNLTNLKKLYLSLNNFSGNLPQTLGNLSQLSVLHLNQNNFNGMIPVSFGSLINLEELLLSQNKLVGTIPAQLGDLSKLRSLIMSQNQLTGTIPDELGKLSNLFFLYADENQLSGQLPSQIGNLTNLRELWLNKNMLSGSIASEISNLSKLQKLLLNENNFSGSIPSFIGNLTDLVSLHVSKNNLNGSLPASLGNLTKLISFLAGENQLSGPIPSSFVNMKSLINLDLHNNQLTGEIPESFGNLISLKRIYLQNNQLEGCFPESMQKYCTLAESSNVSSAGYNFRNNDSLIFGGDFKRWCSGEGRVNAQITSNAPICEGSALHLNATGGITYEWLGPLSFTADINNPTINEVSSLMFGTYAVVVINENKCRDTSTIVISSIGAVSATGNGPVCEGVNIELKADGGLSYKWSGPDNYSSVLQNPVIANSTIAMSGIYTVEIITNDCVIKKEVEIKFVTFGTITSNSPVCEGDTIRLEVSDGISYQWTGPDGFSSDKKSPVINLSELSSAGKYSAVINNGNNCIFTLTTEVEITPLHVPLIDDFEGICDNAAEILLPAIVDGFTGVWSGEGVSDVSSGQIFTPAGLKGKQNLTFSPVNDHRCAAIPKKEIFVSYLTITASEIGPSVDDNDSNGAALVEFNSNQTPLIVSYNGPVSSEIITSSNDNLTLQNLKSGRYFISVSDPNGCMDTASVLIRYLKPLYFLPNIINASSTSENGKFYLKGSNVFSYDLNVYGRWGNPVYEGKNLIINDQTQGWFPTDLSLGVYIYVLTMDTFEGPKVVAGSVTVI